MIYTPKSQPAPICLTTEKLKVSGSYSCGDVLQRLQSDFNNKCYLCEEKEPTTINVEHFVSHQGNIDLKFDWNYLFWVCGHCNNTKSNKYDNILNCTQEADNAETNIHYFINPFPKELVALNPLSNDVRTIETVNLLTEIYNGTTQLKTIEGANIRNKLLKEIRAFQSLLFDYYEDSFTNEEALDIKSKIERQLRISSAFTAFKRWIIRDSPIFMIDFVAYLV